MKRTTRRRTWTVEQLKTAVENSRSVRQVLRAPGLVEAGGNYAGIKSWIAEYGLDTSHFRGQGWCQSPPTFRWTTVQILVENSPYTSSHKLRERLLREEILQCKCYNCGLTSWMERPIPLELEHKNGVRTDNRIENLELLCPNCHALTNTYRGRNIKLLG